MRRIVSVRDHSIFTSKPAASSTLRIYNRVGTAAQLGEPQRESIAIPEKDKPSSAAAPRVVRCAIYGRVDTDVLPGLSSGLRHAQERICSEYIERRAHAERAERTWVHVASYFDVGFSGIDMRRPELQRLRDDIAAGTIDMVVVSDFARLSRSNSDFWKLWTFLEEHKVDLAAVTPVWCDTRLLPYKPLLIVFFELERLAEAENLNDRGEA